MIIVFGLGDFSFFWIIVKMFKIFFFVDRECWNISDFELFLFVNCLDFFLEINMIWLGRGNCFIGLNFIFFIVFVVSFVLVFFLWMILFFFKFCKDIFVGEGNFELLIKSFLYLLFNIVLVLLLIKIVVILLCNFVILLFGWGNICFSFIIDLFINVYNVFDFFIVCW